MKITLISIPVLDQNKALNFYTNKLGFEIKENQVLDNGHKWITLVAKEDPNGIELLLEPGPLHHEPTKVYQETLFSSGIPYTQFDVDNVEEEYQLLKEKGVEFKLTPTTYGNVKVAMLNDTCGNYIQLVEKVQNN